MIAPLLGLSATLLAVGTALAEPAVVEIKDYRYQPQTVRVSAGTSVRWINREKRQYHNVWFEQLGEPEPPYLFSGEVYERRFDTPGQYPYRCGPHPEMTGLVVVEAKE